MRCAPVLVLLIAGPALADPGQGAPAAATTSSTAPSTAAPPPQLSAFLFVDLPPPPPPSLRLEALRVANENWENGWRYPQPGDLLGIEGGLWFMGDAHYRPRTARSAALHGGSIGATLAGEILLSTGSPLAGVGALLTGATLDAAAADVDRDSESRRRR